MPYALAVMFVALAALFVWIARWPVYDRSPLEPDELLRYGRPSPATVLAVGSSDSEGRPRVTLEVTPRAERPFRAEAAMPGRSAPQVGDELRVRFDPSKRSRLVVTGTP